MASPKVVIVLLNWRTPDETIACINGLRQLRYDWFEIVVVDNGSADQSEQRLRRQTGITVLQTGENLGYAGGNNCGIRYALEQGTDYVWLLNSDTAVDPDCLTWMVKAMGDGVGLVGPKLLFADTSKVQWNGGVVEWATAQTLSFDRLSQAKPVDRPYPTEVLHGASMLIRREVFDRVGLLPELYFLNYEETEFCVRAGRAGFGLAIEPRAVVWHQAGAAMGQLSPAYYFYMHRNEALFMRRNAAWRWQLVFWPQYIVWMVKGWIVWSLKRRPQPGKVFIQAMIDGLFGRGGKAAI